MVRLTTLLIATWTASAAADVTSDYARASLRHGVAVGERVLARFAPEEYGYVLVGRSPAVLAAFFDEVAERGSGVDLLKIDLPLSGLGGPKFDEAAYDQTLFEYFDRTLAAAELSGPRRLLVIDFAASGESFHRAANYFGRYARSRGAFGRFEGLVLRIDPKVPTLQAPPADLTAAVTRTSGLVIHELKLGLDAWLLFQTGRFKAYAPHGEYKFREERPPRPDPARAPLNPRYDELRAAVRGIMAADACVRALRVLPPPPWGFGPYGGARGR